MNLFKPIFFILGFIIMIWGIVIPDNTRMVGGFLLMILGVLLVDD